MDLGRADSRESARDWRSESDAGDVIRVDVGVVGAGLGGALLALVLARRGVSVAVIDPDAVYPSDFRVEKVHGVQIEMLERLGVVNAVAAGMDIPPGARLSDSGFHYDHIVNAVRAAWPASVRFLQGRVTEVVGVGAGEDQRQRLLADSGQRVEIRLVVLATGLSRRLTARLGLSYVKVRDQQSICTGFTIAALKGADTGLNGLVHRSERAGDKLGFASFFRVGAATRVNLFTYHDARDPWVRMVKTDPTGALSVIAPKLALRLTDTRVIDQPEMRIVDLYRIEGHLRAGLVLIGDAFQTSDPATAFGVTRLLTDIDRLLERLPQWLATPGMDVDKIEAFYADPIKQAHDAENWRKAARGRAAATETTLRWRVFRLAARLKRLATGGVRGLDGPQSARPALHAGDWIEVRSATAIEASLDAAGELDGLPFMPEMAAFCGRRLRVWRRANKTCVEGHGLRGMTDAYLLDDTRCDGAQHDGCERGCLIFWKRSWLRMAAEPPPPLIDPDVEASARRRLEELPTRDGERYRCQSTQLHAATFELSRWSLGHLIDDLRHGEVRPSRLMEISVRTLINLTRRGLGLPELGALTGQDGQTRVSLRLAKGERVRIKKPAGIAATLDAAGKNRGLSFEPEMTMLAGRSFRVAGPVKKIIVETNGRMAQLKSTVALEGVDCQGRCARNCPRANPLYWREAWLERDGDKPSSART